jgi:nucleoside-diphosphate-sugar epimerase
LTVHGDGSQTRSFTWIDDVVDGFVKAGEVNSCPNMVFNIGSTEEISILELANKVAKFSTNGSEVTYGDGYFGDSNRRLPEISRAVELLNWQSKVSLDDGLELMWDSLTT